MRSFTATFFVLLYMLAMTRPIMPLFEYILNEDYIAEFLCINKDNIALNCNGKCYLMQKLEKQNEEKRQNLPKIALEDYPIGFVFLARIEAHQTKIVQAKSYFEYRNLYRFLYSQQSSHPPNSLV
ncbi:hypothetical protein [Maribacter sp. 2304DJ31-5]|uniref:hypothetical protein n=1 Tax=Maribacter sp. 2304DJ31-5 TaxID=3386273 RepID=UPI0039BCCA0D